MKLIIVEDDKDQIISYLDTITVVNSSGGGHNIENPKVVGTLTEALEAIENKHFDGAIVDLKLSRSNRDKTDGNEIIGQIVNLKRFPVFVYSSFLEDIDPAIENSFFFQQFERTTVPFRDVVIKLHDIYKTGVTKILGRDGAIESHLTKIFWKHVAESFEGLCQKGITEKQLLRYITGHLYEYLELDDMAESFKKYLPEEVYIKPSIKLNFFTGGIIKDKNSQRNFIILTPSCDIVQNKAKSMLLASVRSLTDDPVRDLKTKSTNRIPADLRGAQRQVAEEEKKTAKKQLEDLIRNNYSHKYYFLPRSKNFEGGLINFQDLESVEPAAMNGRFDIIATINNQFLKDIVAKFSFYYSRQGAPEVDFSVADLP